ncbi:hypothetical protein [Alcanivorax sp. 1008]|uniref:hypothetical protein n=1 Tax=Alcanivorax sp. 1008 TaxID=2816853 RepID=UPI001DCC1318|nr:hypothetical protein [Alcanivorax sp. 1008]MCC1497935.1 hypothetical protein [Alcanivorax sp. 1008]
MSFKKQIIVVAPKQYKDLARKLAHNISKQPGYSCTFWTVVHYEQNEFSVASSQHVILIGNEEENSVTKSLISEIGNIKNKAGACFGFDGSKAVVFGTGELEQGEEFKSLVVATSALINEKEDSGSMGKLLAKQYLAVALVPGIGLMKLVSMIGRQKRLRLSQTNTALTLFLDEMFDKWVGIDE